MFRRHLHNGLATTFTKLSQFTSFQPVNPTLSPLATAQVWAPLPATRTYQVDTVSTVQVKQDVGLSESSAKFRHTLLESTANGYVFQTEQLASQLKNTDPSSMLLAEFNALNESLVLATDRHGNLQELLNGPEVTARWHALRQRMRTTYARLPSLPALLAAMDQQLLDPVALLNGMRHKGAFGLLYAGIWGYPIDDQELVVSQQVIKNYLGPLDLPLQLVATAELDPAAPGQTLITRTGTLDPLKWEEQAFRQMLRRLVDSFSFDATLRLTCHEQYRLDRATGWLVGATQHLRAEVPGAYVNDVRHTLTVSN
jgi:hypothetical protein